MSRKEKMIVAVAGVVIFSGWLIGVWKMTGGGCVYSPCQEETCVDLWKINLKKSKCAQYPEFKCFRLLKCERQKNRRCGLSKTEAGEKCLSRMRKEMKEDLKKGK